MKKQLRSVRQASLAVLLLALTSGCLYDWEDSDYYSGESDLRVQGETFGGVMGDVSVRPDETTFHIDHSYVAYGGYAEIDLRGETPDGFAMAMLTFNDGLDLDSLVPGTTLGSTGTDSGGYAYSPVSLMACSGPADGTWHYDRSGNARVQVEPSELEGHVRLVFEADLTRSYDSDEESGLVTGSFDIGIN